MRGAVLSAAASLLLVAAAEPASAGQIDCGDVITGDVVLGADLSNCPNNGLVIGADGVTLDLNGHTIDGDGTPFAACGKELCDAGIASERHDGLRVIGGVVRDFAVGAFAAGGKHIRFLRLRAKRNEFFGMFLFDVSRSKIRKSSGSRNPKPDGDGLGIFGSRRVRVLNSVFRRNFSLGVHVEDSTRIELRGNLFEKNAGPGMSLSQANRNEVRHNRCVDNAACVVVGSGNGNVITRNRVIGGDDGFGVEDASRNRVLRNRVHDVDGSGIYLGLLQPALGGDHNLVQNNTVRRTGGDAIVVRPKAGHSVLRGNTARRADQDGVDVGSASTLLANNLATGNRDLGIEAAPGVTDGGGNRASDNGDPRQCVGVSCG